ncbi:IS607 family transposase [Moorena sp. SIO4G3]|uniref:IS607 family transposase n=1 Tax=Moorena sp. SIO4G3 TaxID=2607821 RepID=UPI0014291910|nr:IS607 family transposase [Moorena sp. SIO4G3]NEO77639.1 IS607 family transposase [Moorena sp. SIO4G3]
MRLKDYAKQMGVSYQTAWRWWKAGKLPHPAFQTESGSVIVEYFPQQKTQPSNTKRVAIYGRVSSAEHKSEVELQVQRLQQYAIAKGYTIVKVIKEVGSGLNDNRQQLASLLNSDGYDILLVEHKDSLARFGINYLEILLSRLGIQLEIVNQVDNSKDELMQDFIAIVKSFSPRLYSQDHAKKKIEKIIAELQADGGDDYQLEPNQ